MSTFDLTRRNLFKVSALAAGGLMLEVSLPNAALAQDDSPLVESKQLNVYVQIASDGKISIYSAIPEMGQGVKTSLPMIVAEEMGARWEDVVVIQAPVDQSKFGLQLTGGSTAIPRNFDTMRQMGASAREMLIGAASSLMEVDRLDLSARDSQVVHTSGRSMTFGELAAAAARQPLPDPEMLSYKDPRSYTIIGSPRASVDNLDIVTGQSQFGIDVDLPGMQFATYTRCPRIGGIAKSFNEAEIKGLPGITDAFILEPDDNAGKAAMAFLQGLTVLRGGVAIIGEDTWSVFSAKSRLKVTWDEAQASTDSWQQLVSQAKQMAKTDRGDIRKDSPTVDSALADRNNRQLEAFYQFPYVAHVCMEPMNCTAHFVKGEAGQADTMELWLGSQFPGQTKEIAANMLDLKPEQVTVHAQRMGGGFGRRALNDFAGEAMAISRRVEGPVKLCWNRTDDIHNDFFRAGGF